MLRYHMAMISRDNALKRAVKRLTTATGSTADFPGDAGGIDGARPPHLVIFDARDADPDKAFYSRVPPTAKIVFILDGDTLVDKLPLLKDDRVTSLFCHDARFDDDEFISTATKALRGEVFGLQKYFPWGVTTFSMKVKNYDEKGRAIDVLLEYAGLAGVRGPVRDRIQLVCDELMMNALYHAPVDAAGNEVYAGRSLKELAHLPEVNAIQVQYGCSGRYFGVSVRDAGGSLGRARALEYLLRARTGSHIESKSTGAGLGLISVLRSVSKLIFNLDPRHSTEVIGLFDMELFAKGKVGARSLHLFQAGPRAAEDDDRPAAGRAAAAPLAGMGRWTAAAAVLGAITAALGTAVYMKQGRTASAGPQAPAGVRSITVFPEPADATVSLDGAAIPAAVKVPWLAAGPPERVLAVEKPGFQRWERKIGAGAGDLQFHVSLQPGRPR